MTVGVCTMIYSMISLYTFIFGWPNKDQIVGWSMYLVRNKSVVFIDFCDEIEEKCLFERSHCRQRNDIETHEKHSQTQTCMYVLYIFVIV